MQTIILAAGLGTRLEPVTSRRSKVMVPVANKPFLSWLVAAVQAAVQGDVILVVRKDQKDVIGCFSPDERVRFAYQDEPRGTADAVKSCEDLVDGPFMVINGDCYAPQEGIAELAGRGANALAVFTSPRPKLFGSVLVQDGVVQGIEEKTGSGNLVNAGFYVFDRAIFDAIAATKPSSRDEYELTDAVGILMETRGVKAFQLSGWKTITYPWDLLELNEALLREKGSMISPDAEIRPGAVIEEPAAIGARAVVGPNCFIRRYSAVGRNCKIGNAVEIKNSIIMDNSFVSHLSYVGDSIVGENCNIAAGAIFANLRLDERTVGMTIKGDKIDSGRKKLGALIGDNVKLGVNVTIMPGKKIYPDIMVPACCKVEQDLEKQIPLK